MRRILLSLLFSLMSGCGYTWSDNGSSFAPEAAPPRHGIYRDDVKTVAAPIFANQTYYRGVELGLSKAIVNQIESRTPYKVVPKEQADTILEGEIANVVVRTVSRYQFNGLPQNQLYVVTVNFTWKDLRTGEILVQRHHFEQTAPYYPTLGEDQFIGEQENIEKLAIAIVEELQADWGKTSTTKP